MMIHEAEKMSLDDIKVKPKDYQTLSPSKIPPSIDPEPEDPKPTEPKKRVPRRVLHFSDGILEEYSTDEEEVEERKKKLEIEEQERKTRALIDPKTLSWLPWMVHYTWFAGSTIVSYCDHWGEKLAWFFGITSPKYYYELEEFQKMKDEEEARKAKMDVESHGWSQMGELQVIEGDPTKLQGNESLQEVKSDQAKEDQ